MTKYLPILITIIGTVSGAVAFPDFVAHHATVFAVLAAIGQGLHAALPSIFGETKQ